MDSILSSLVTAWTESKKWIVLAAGLVAAIFALWWRERSREATAYNKGILDGSAATTNTTLRQVVQTQQIVMTTDDKIDEQEKKQIEAIDQRPAEPTPSSFDEAIKAEHEALARAKEPV